MKHLHKNTFLGYSLSIQNHLLQKLLNAVVFRSTSWTVQSLPERWIGHAPLNCTYLGVIFGHDVGHAPTNKLKAGFVYLVFLSERYDQNNDPKNTKATITCLIKRIKKKAGFQFFGTCGPNTTLKFQIENLTIARGIAEILFSPFFVENT